jgi:hypothetical protein
MAHSPHCGIHFEGHQLNKIRQLYVICYSELKGPRLGWRCVK